jgi:hypothetical protein
MKLRRESTILFPSRFFPQDFPITEILHKAFESNLIPRGFNRATIQESVKSSLGDVSCAGFILG